MKTNYELYIFMGVIIVVMGAFLYFFLGSTDYSLNMKKELDVSGSKVTFKAKAKALEMELNDPKMFDGENGVAKEVKSEVLLTLDTDKKVNCTYDLIYKHDDEYIRYSKTESSNNEFTISYDGSEEVQITDFGSDFVIGTFNISGPIQNDTKEVTLKFYNLDEDQQRHINTVYHGNLDIANIKCS